MSVAPHVPGVYRNDKVGVAVCVAVGVVGVVGVWETLVLWRHLGRAADYASGEPGVTLEQLAEGVKALTMFDMVARIGLLASGIMLMIWLSRARGNAEVLCRAGHRGGGDGSSVDGSAPWSACGFPGRSSMTFGVPVIRTRPRTPSTSPYCRTARWFGRGGSPGWQAVSPRRRSC